MDAVERESLISETLADPCQSFVIWLLGHDVINTAADIEVQFDDPSALIASLNELVTHGFVSEQSTRLSLEPIAIEVLAWLKSQSARTVKSSADDKNLWTDEALFVAASQDDREAFTILQSRIIFIDHYLKGLCIKYSVPEDVAYAISFQTLSQACNHLRDRHVPRQKSRRRWLQRLAEKEFSRWITNNQPLFPLGAPQLATPFKHSTEEDAITSLAGECFDLLNYEQMHIIGLVMANGLSVEDAGDRMGLDSEEAMQLYFLAISTLSAHVETKQAQMQDSDNTDALSDSAPSVWQS